MIRSATLIALGIIFSTSSYSSTELHVFGDSLSDQGHAPIFASGELVKAGATFTNKTTGKPGKVWISYFSSLIKVDEPQPRSPIWEKYYGVDNIEATGFAVAGYTTDDIYSSIVDKGHYQELSKSGLRGSSVFYSKQYFTVNDGYFHTEVSRKPDHVIATLWGGGNDLLKGGDPVRAADTLMKSVKALYDRDNIKCLILLDMPDLGALPFNYIISEKKNLPIDDYNTKKSKVSDTFNAQMGESIEALRDKVQFIRVSKLFSDVQENPENFGFSATNQSKYCINPVTEPHLPSVPCIKHPEEGSKLAFNDGIHPSTEMHKLVAQFVYDQIKSEDSCKAGDSI